MLDELNVGNCTVLDVLVDPGTYLFPPVNGSTY